MQEEANCWSTIERKIIDGWEAEANIRSDIGYSEQQQGIKFIIKGFIGIYLLK